MRRKQDYDFADVQTELNNAQIARGLNFGDEFDLCIFKRVITSYLPEIKDADMEAMIKDFKARMEEERIDALHDSNPDDETDGAEDDEE